MNLRHEESYFTRNKSDTGRFFFLFGRTNDLFCEDNLVNVGLDRLLHAHLKRKGVDYERIIFYSKDEKLYFYDMDSYNLTLRVDDDPKESAAKAPAKPSRLQAPIAGKLKTSDAPAPASTEAAALKIKAGKIYFGRMDETTAFKRVNSCIKSSKAKTAVIFTNADDFIKYFVPRASEDHVFDSFNQYDSGGPDNQNIVLFIFPKGDQSEVAANYENTFFCGRMKAENTIIINPPAAEEIRNTINYYRLMRGLKVDFTCLDAVCKKIARELCRFKRPLIWLMEELSKIIKNNIVLNTEQCDAMFKEKNNETALQKLDKLVGMEEVKTEIRMLESRKGSDENPATDKKHHSRILPPILKEDGTYKLHYVITGNPGTGKTTAARLLGEIMYESGYLESGHTVEAEYKDLVSQYNPGDTASQTSSKIEEAMGGVLFIDEAYTLAPSDEQGSSNWGKMAIDTILKAMSDRDGQFAVVVAGYPEQMNTFIQSNPGLKRRFLKTIHIEDYEPEELMQIFNRYLRSNTMRKKYIPSVDLSAMLGSFFENWHRSKDKNWGNAGVVETLLQEMDGNWQKRKGEKSPDGELILDICDIPDNLQRHCRPSEESKEEAMSRLKKLIGLNTVKERIEGLKLDIAFEGNTDPGHYIFAGNPGTGKTTVAGLLGDILREEKVLRRGHVVTVKREDLVAEYTGQTAPKTKDKLNEALDGILFIDEAYSLVDEGHSSFGQEAINTIVAFMEEHRNRISIICAGYTQDMLRFRQSNKGLKSRFIDIHFDDYDVNELVEILHSFGEGYILEQDFIQKSRKIFELWIQNKNDEFGNARDVRNYFNECKTTLRKRLISEYGSIADIPEEAKKTLTGQDIPLRYSSIAKGA